jgi:hypothetical protein
MEGNFELKGCFILMLAENQNPTPEKSLLKNPLALFPLLLLVAALYLGWVFFSRHREDQQYNRRVRDEQAQKQREADQATIQQLGGNDLAIQMLYATPEVRRGQTAQVCFGVANAKSVALEPQPSPVWPSHSLCVDVKPAKTTTYTLTATAADGKSLTQQVTVAVR